MSCVGKRELIAAAGGAVVSGLILVSAYAAKQPATPGKSSVALGTGEGARTTEPSGSNAGDLPSASDPPGESESAEGGVMGANRNLVEQVSELRARLERVESEKQTVERQFSEANAKLQVLDAGLLPYEASKPQEITQDEWRNDLAKQGTIKARIPCNWKGGWTPSPQKLNELALAPSDGPTLREASNRLYEQTWSRIRPLCVRLVTAEVADKLGVDACTTVLIAYARGNNKGAADEAMRRVAEMRAGLRPLASVDDPSLAPPEKVFLVLTGEQKAFEEDLARSLGPEEAHRIATSSALCTRSAKYDGPGPRKK